MFHGGLVFKDLALSLLWLRFDPRPQNFCMLGGIASLPPKKMFCFIGCHFPSPLLKESSLFWGLFFSVLRISGWLSSSVIPIGCMSNKTIQETDHGIIPWFPEFPCQSAFSLSPLRVLSLFYMSCLGFIAILSRKDR